VPDVGAGGAAPAAVKGASTMPERSEWEAQIDRALADVLREVQGLHEAQEARGERLEARLTTLEERLTDARRDLDQVARRVDDAEHRVGAVGRGRPGWREEGGQR
jgi:hypothetical protein